MFSAIDACSTTSILTWFEAGCRDGSTVFDFWFSLNLEPDAVYLNLLGCIKLLYCQSIVFNLWYRNDLVSATDDHHVTAVLMMQIMQCALMKFDNAETVILLLILGRAIWTLDLSSWCYVFFVYYLIVYYSTLKFHFLLRVFAAVLMPVINFAAQSVSWAVLKAHIKHCVLPPAPIAWCRSWQRIWAGFVVWYQNR